MNGRYTYRSFLGC